MCVRFVMEDDVDDLEMIRVSVPNMNVCTYSCTHVMCPYVCMHVYSCTHVMCAYVCMHVCMYVS